MKLYLALPVMNESENLPAFLKCLSEQAESNFELFVCVNQPDLWWTEPDKVKICNDNRRSIKILKTDHSFPVHLIDRSSPGRGWKGKHYGVGWARKTTMDAINIKAHDKDIIISMDADTFYPPDYLSSVQNLFERFPTKVGLSNPYYHLLSDEEKTDRAMLRYEIYMRSYSINMLRINNPYSFTALGSAMSFPLWAYRKVNGITPHKSGEDFYFLQKLRKSGELILWNRARAFPSPRPSDRVFFGTGPAIIKGIEGNWNSYPIYHYKLFDEVKKNRDAFHDLFQKDFIVPMSGFLHEIFKEENIWRPLRENSKSADQFADACFRKIDALRILQYLKYRQNQLKYSNEFCLKENLICFKADFLLPEDFRFEIAEIELLDEIRNRIVLLEDNLQRATLTG
ncbi:MAG: glycosyltransferase [Bacteroidales bacterium]|nr:glycosyltransferase [Bacteroidales bacterium]MCF8345167.1 glycosyltransferase [Bacteroidales bacterium]MCF8350565.1 glycosyltransferase [Bacteroidales bacterium]MCF8377067.1 glycosyltransferase [Bacteroidales bacterium]MCF8400941.1 glycosyltransferase [Bacteroidales bacterium]